MKVGKNFPGLMCKPDWTGGEFDIRFGIVILPLTRAGTGSILVKMVTQSSLNNG